MGAQYFVIRSEGKTAMEAFRKAVEEAQYESGHGGYTGTIAEKDRFKMVTFTEEQLKNPVDAAEALCYDGPENAFYQDKWGHAACVDLGLRNMTGQMHSFLFFGWASS